MQTYDRSQMKIIAFREDEPLVKSGRIWRTIREIDGSPLYISAETKADLEKRVKDAHYDPANIIYDDFSVGQWVQFNTSADGSGKLTVGKITGNFRDPLDGQPRYHVPLDANDPHGTRYELKVDRLTDASLVYDQPQKNIIQASEYADLVTHTCELCENEASETLGGHQVCPDHAASIRAYEQKVQARLDRMETSAEKAMSEAIATTQRAHDMASVIPFGQPILVGHHSERRDRRYRERIEKTYRRGFEAQERATRRQQRVKSASKNKAISSDDPAALLKLRDKLAELEALQQKMKATNKVIRQHSKSNAKHKKELDKKLREAYRVNDNELAHQLVAESRAMPDRDIDKPAATAALLEMGYKESHIENLLAPDFAQRVGIPPYALRNNNAEIRRLKQRIEELAAKAQVEVVAEEQHGDIAVIRDTEDNRIRLIFPDKPDTDTRALLKANGFRWSPSNGAWQRQLNGNGEWAVQRVLKRLGLSQG